MALRIEDYALIGNCLTSALVGRDGSIDWLCLPRFDSAACFSALLGGPENGRWLIAPEGPILGVERQYRPDTMILETRFCTETGIVTLIDFIALPGRHDTVNTIRIVRGESGTVRMKMEAVFRFDYGRAMPWVQQGKDGLRAVVGPDALLLRTPVTLEGHDMTTVASFTIAQGNEVPFVLSGYPSHLDQPPAIDAAEALTDTETRWRGWSTRYENDGEWRDPVMRSLLTLKALTYAPTGGIVAAPTTSLPELMGGIRNWDYRYCWLRDATFTLYSFLLSGYRNEAMAWREWLLRAVAGSPAEVQVMYGIAGERRLPEYELPWLQGHQGSAPVRIGNAAHTQRQTDVFGELMDAFYSADMDGMKPYDDVKNVQKALLDHLEGHWQLPDSGIWEMRGPEQRYTHSAVMAWVAFDRAIKSVEKFGLTGPVDRWTSMRDSIHAEVCEKGFDSERGVFVQHYGAKDLDSALLRIPLVGFLPANDPRVVATADAILRELTVDGFVCRYRTGTEHEGLPPGEGTFLMCSFWMADNLAMMGRYKEARVFFERLLSIRNDVGLLAEEYDPRARQFLGNFPQAFSHVGVINTAHNLTLNQGPADKRAAH